MKSMEQLEKSYIKEMELADKHKKNAADIKKQMELQQGRLINQKINSLNMSGMEYDRLMKLLSSGKKTILEAAEIVLGDITEKGGEKGNGAEISES